MSLSSDSIKSPFIIPAEVFDQLDPIEKIIIRAQAKRGEVRILEPEATT